MVDELCPLMEGVQTYQIRACAGALVIVAQHHDPKFYFKLVEYGIVVLGYNRNQRPLDWTQL